MEMLKQPLEMSLKENRMELALKEQLAEERVGRKQAQVSLGEGNRHARRREAKLAQLARAR